MKLYTTEVALINRINAIEGELAEERVYRAYLLGICEVGEDAPDVVQSQEKIVSLCQEKAALRAVRCDEL